MLKPAKHCCTHLTPILSPGLISDVAIISFRIGTVLTNLFCVKSPGSETAGPSVELVPTWVIPLAAAFKPRA